MPTAKKQALAMVKKLPEKATGDDIMYEIYVRKILIRVSPLPMKEE